MSWDQYVEQLKGDTVVEAGIFGLDGSIWSSTEGLKNVTGEQIKALAGESEPMRQCGPKIGTRKCMLIKDDREDQQSLCLHLKTSLSDGKLSVCVGKSLKALVVVIGSGQANQLSGPVYRLVKYLKEQGY